VHGREPAGVLDRAIKHGSKRPSAEYDSVEDVDAEVFNQDGVQLGKTDLVSRAARLPTEPTRGREKVCDVVTGL
jgi:hypothetical protein